MLTYIHPIIEVREMYCFYMGIPVFEVLHTEKTETNLRIVLHYQNSCLMIT